MHGEGRLSVLGGLYNKEFRRMTVEKIEALEAREVNLYDHFEEEVDNDIWT